MNRTTITAALLITIGLAGAAPAVASPGPGPGMCQYLGSQYPVYYPCDEYQPWLPYGTPGNPQAGREPFGVPDWNQPPTNP